MTVLARLSTSDIITIIDLIDDLDHPSPATVALGQRLSDLMVADALHGGDAE